jgi:hypothetical protein
MSLTQDLSIYIPRVDTRSLPPIVTNGCQFIGATGEFEDNLRDYMAKTFHYNNIGDVDRIDLIPKETPQGHTYFIAFVHFKEWQDTVAARQLQKDINDPQVKAKIHFNESWYWICSKNNKPAKTPPEKGPSYDELKAIVAAQNETIASLQAIIDQFKMAANPYHGAVIEDDTLAEDGYPKPGPPSSDEDMLCPEDMECPSPPQLRRTDNSPDIDLGERVLRKLNWNEE